MEYFRRISIIVEAIQFTDVMHNEFILMGKTPGENPVDVNITGFEDANTYWNWHTQELYLRNHKREKIINVGDYIIKKPNGKFYTMSEKKFLKNFNKHTLT